MQQQTKLHWQKCKRDEVIFWSKYFSTHKFYLKGSRYPNNFFEKHCLSDTLKSAGLFSCAPLGYTFQNSIVHTLCQKNAFLFIFFFNIKYFSTHKFYIQLLVIQIIFFHKLCLCDTLKSAGVCPPAPLVYINTSEKPKIVLRVAKSVFGAIFFNPYFLYIATRHPNNFFHKRCLSDTLKSARVVLMCAPCLYIRKTKIPAHLPTPRQYHGMSINSKIF